MSSKDYISLTKLKRLVPLTDSDIITLLDCGALDTQIGPNGCLLVNSASVTEELLRPLIAQRQNNLCNEDRTLIEEIVAAETLSLLGECIDDACELIKQWQMK